MKKRDVILERAEMLRDFPGQKLPEATDELLEKAGRIVKGTIFFYGTDPVEVGLKDIDWSGQHVKHQEWPAQLNRFGYLLLLASAWKATGDDRYPSAARSYVEDWIDHHPESGELVGRDNRLNVSIRLGSSMHHGWGGTLPAFLTSSAFDDAFVEKILDSMNAQAGWLSGELTTRGNWRISQLDALIFTALRFPFLSSAEKLLTVGIRGMRNALRTQFLPDGVHVERTPSYHTWMARVLANYFRLAEIFPEADVGVTRERLRGPLDYMVHSALSGFNDATAPFADPPSLRELEERRRIFEDDPPLEQVFRDAGQVFLRSSWEPGADYLAFDASTWGGWHSHLSRLSFVFRSKGRALLTDTGILSYEVTEPIGPYGKSTPAHSTLNLNGWNQGESDAQIMRTEFTPDFALIDAKYQGSYWEKMTWKSGAGHGAGIFGVHERVLFWVKGEYLLVLDRMECDEGATVHNCWQLAPTDAWEMDADALAWHSKNSDVNLLVKLVYAPEGTEMQCFEGETEAPRGLVGDAAQRRRAAPAPLVEFRYPGKTFAGRFTATLLVPFEGPGVPEFTVTEARTARDPWSRDQLHYLTLTLPDGATDTVGWSNDLELPVEIDGPFVTDARFVWCRRDANRNVLKHFLLDGTYLDVDGKTVRK